MPPPAPPPALQLSSPSTVSPWIMEVTRHSSGADGDQLLSWKSASVSSGSHTLVPRASVNIGDFATAAGLPVTITSGGSTSVIFGSVLRSPPTGGVSGSKASVTATAVVLPSSSPSAAADGKTSSHFAFTAAIVAALVLVVCICAGLLARRRRRQRTYADTLQLTAYMSSALTDGPPSTQSLLPQGHSGQEAYDPDDALRNSSTSSTPSLNQTRSPLRVTKNKFLDSIADLKHREQKATKSDENDLSDFKTAPVQHVDGGVSVLNSIGPGASELPPVYTP
ncbi:hypothetical protein DFH09DRAFT_1410721 [Mycena vulgaris]|nr:hypothetical protein DFH09DRAFT_1410721 [Mycena vulgaris]